MERIAMWRRQFNWRMLLMRIVVNALALLVTAGLVPKIYFVDRTILTWLLLAIGLGVLNALIKPIVQFLTLRFIFATYGLVLALINGIILFLLSVLLPARFEVDGVFWALVGGLVLGIISALLENLLGLTPPIVSEKYPELRQKIKDKESGSLESYITQTAVEKTLHPVHEEQQDASPAVAAAAVLAVVGTAEEQPPAPPGAESESAAFSEAPAEESAMAQDAVLDPQRLAEMATLPAEQEA